MKIFNRINFFSLINIIRFALAFTVALTFISFIILNQQMGYIREYLYQTSELKVLTQVITKDASEAVINADAQAFKDLSDDIREFSMHIDILLNGKKDSAGNMIVPPNKAVTESQTMKNLLGTWEIVRNEAQNILNNQTDVSGIYDLMDEFSDTLNHLEDSNYEVYEKASSLGNLNKGILDAFMSQMYDISKVEDAIRRMLSMSELFTDEMEQSFNSLMDDLDKTSAYIQENLKIPALGELYSQINESLKLLGKNRQKIVTVGRLVTDIYYGSRQKIVDLSLPFLDEATQLEKKYSMAKGYFVTPALAYGLSGLSVLLLLLLFFVTHRQNIKELKKSEEENRLLQSDIKKLVEEIEDLATGNLTVKATISSGVTKEIAEAVNFALNALKNLVLTINTTANRLYNSTKEVRKIATDLALSSERQADQIEKATGAVNTMANSIDRVSSNAKESATVAEKSVSIAKKGALVVQNTMAGMDRIREQIKETEKRIRRLGDSSQEIGEIVLLINGISEQTNILSLNASIQAAMAGEAGKGFAVVADEVQRLAEKSSVATKEVETLVKTIQTDTARAVESMEKAITEVVTGTELATNAGGALEKIEKVSENLSELIQHISTTAEEQAKVASKISNMMVVIEDITKQTASGSSNTSEAIGVLVDLADDLHKSVAGFKLPKESNGSE